MQAGHSLVERAFFLLYNLLLLLTIPFAGSYYLRRLLKEDYRRGFSERLGYLRLEVRRPVWFHAVSVGEVNAVAPLIEEMRRRHPSQDLLLSTVTPTGRKVAEGLLAPGQVFYLPFDLPWIVRRVVRSLRPRVVCLVETELWPNLIRTLEEEGIPVVLVNGRLSQRSFKRYMRLRPFFKAVLKGVTLLSVQTERDARRFISLGVEKEKVFVSGNLKYHQDIHRFREEEIGDLLSELGLKGTEKVIVAGSTHRGEESIIVEAFKRLKSRHPSARLILVPRHPDRAGEVEGLLEDTGLTSSRRGRDRGFCGRDVLIVDTIGELKIFYALSHIAFVGGSLIRHGGQNLIEPAYFRKPVLFGPHVENFYAIASELLEAGGGVMVKDGEELYTKMDELLSNPSLCKRIGESAYRVVERGKGALERNLHLLEGVIDGTPS